MLCLRKYAHMQHDNWLSYNCLSRSTVVLLSIVYCLWFALTTTNPYGSIASNLFIYLYSTADYTIVFTAMYYVTFINPKCIQQDSLSYKTIMPYNSPAICIRLYEKPCDSNVSPAWPGFFRLD